MSSAELPESSQKRCTALFPQAVCIYMSFKHAQWVHFVKQFRATAAYRCASATDLDDQWESALQAVYDVIYCLENCIEEENGGENWKRPHRLCVIDRAEQAAHLAIEAARLQGRMGHARAYTLAFAFDKSRKFLINAMLAYGEGDHVREDAWLEASRLIESKEFAAKGKEDLEEFCNFQYYPKRAANDVPIETRELIDGLPDSGRPFAMADHCSYRAWAFGVLGKIYYHIRRNSKAYELRDGSSPFDFQDNQYTIKRDRYSHAADCYVHAGCIIRAAQAEPCELIRLLHRRCGSIAVQIAASNAEGGEFALNQQLGTNADSFMSIASAVKGWRASGQGAAERLAESGEQVEEQALALLEAEIREFVHNVIASELYTRPEGDHAHLVNGFLAQVAARTEAADNCAVDLEMEEGRCAHYLQRMHDVNPAMSPAHEQLRRCWQKAAVAVDPAAAAAASQLAGAALRTSSSRPRKLTAPSKVSLWLAINYAHLADGLYADAAAYFLRAGQATVAGDAEQAKCWQTAAEALMKAADASFKEVEESWPHLRPNNPKITTVLPDRTVFEKDASPWVRCGETLALLSTVGCARGSSDCVALRRALVSLAAQLERGTRGAAEKMAFAYGLGGQGGLRAQMIATGERLLEALASVATAARSGSGDVRLPAERVAFLARLGVVVEDLYGEYSTIEARLWKDHNGEIVPTRGEDSRRFVGAGECVVAGLEKAVSALSAKSELGAEEAYLEALRQNEVAADLVAKASQSAEASV